MEQLSFIIDTLEESIKKQMLKAINKGIIPGAIVIFDGVKQDRNIVIALSLGNVFYKLDIIQLFYFSKYCFAKFPKILYH